MAPPESHKTLADIRLEIDATIRRREAERDAIIDRMLELESDDPLKLLDDVRAQLFALGQKALLEKHRFKK